MENKEFQWSDELVKEFFNFASTIKWSLENPIIEQFKELKSKELSKPKGYEIISYIYGCKILSHESDGYYSQGKAYPMYNEKQLADLGAKIHSVKRLSDGEVFTVGKTRLKHSEHPNGLLITGIKFSEYGNSLVLVAGDKNFHPKYVTVLKEPKPLFTTEDGKEVFDKTETVWVLDTDGEEWLIWSANAASCSGEKKYFSTEDKAKKHIAYKKPQFSLEEIILLSTKHQVPCEFESEIIKIAQEKINNQ